MSELIEQAKEISGRRLQIDRLESAIRSLPDHLDSADGDSNEYIQTTHFFSPGVYTRQMTCKKDVYLVGKVHRYGCLTILLKGRMVATSSTDDIAPGTILEPGTFWISTPMAKRAFVALEDSALITVHQNPTNTTDLDELEAAIIVESTQ